METIYELIGKSISNEITPEEKIILDQWIQESAENKSLYNELVKNESYTQIFKDAKNLDLEKAKTLTWYKIEQFARQKEKAENQIREQVKKFYLKRTLQYAAVFVLLLGTASYFFFSGLKSYALQVTEISAPKGARTNLKLADGTSVWLNAGSTLKYDNNFNKENRTVYLDGEAFFDVTKNAQKPFFVKTADLSMKVLGTSFNVKSYSDEGITQTTLVTGSIEIEKSHAEGKETAPIILKPNQRITYIQNQKRLLLTEPGKSESPGTFTQAEKNNVQDNSLHGNEVMIADHVDVEQDISWKDGYMVVFREPLQELAIKLERRYDVTITFVNDEIKTYKFTGKILDLTLDQVLNAIQISSPIEYRIEKKKVIIRKK